MHGYGCVNPIVCPPQYRVRDCYIPRMVPVIHPIITVNRHNIIDVPQHVYQPIVRDVVINRGFVQNMGMMNRTGTMNNARRAFGAMNADDEDQ